MIAFAEACPGIGLFVSSVFLVIVTGYLYSEQLATLYQIVPLAFFGALLSDHAGFYLGRAIGPALHRAEFVRKRKSVADRAENLIRRFGWGAILVGRFIPAIRSIIPALTGVSGLHPLRFLAIDLGACLAWSLGLAAILLGVERVLA